MNWLNAYLNVDALSIIMMGLVGFVGLIVGNFAQRYLAGDRKAPLFFICLVFLIAAVFVMVCADHLLVFLLAWGTSNVLLVRLMIHKLQWRAAKASGLLALKNFTIGFVCVALAFWFLYDATGLTSIQAILVASIDPAALIISLSFLMVGVFTQSALMPFHRWLTSSLNSPTPVSAIMHAGLVNGGGFLLARFALLYVQVPHLLSVLFVVGMATAMIGTLWKLMQQDIKRMLACSTMGQMGFMVAQCGLGLFPAAVAHLCWHGLFKAYLFLASGGAANNQRTTVKHSPHIYQLLLAIICGIAGATAFASISHKLPLLWDTNLFLTAIALIAGAQMALPMIQKTSLLHLSIALLFTVVAGTLYGGSVLLIEATLAPLNLHQPQPFGALHGVILGIAFIAWLAKTYDQYLLQNKTISQWLTKAYVQMLNASQPAAKTITAHRNHYQC